VKFPLLGVLFEGFGCVLGGKSAYRLCFPLAVTLASSAAAPTWAQLLPSNAQSSQISNADCAQVTEGSSSKPDDRLDCTEEGCGGLCPPATKGDDSLDRLKHVGLGRPFWYVSFGAELRGSYEVYRNYNWGTGPQDRNGYYLNRVIGNADFHC
jgi:hypothetical protein